MRRLVVVLLAVSDWLCWLLVFLGVLCTVVYPLANLTFWPRIGEPVSVVALILGSAFSLLIAGGAFALLKRRLLGLLPLFLPAVLFLVLCEYSAFAVATGLVLVLFAAPYALIFLVGPRVSRATPEA
jgi:hypothetical protein